MNGRHFGRARRDEENADILRFTAVRLAEFRPCDLGCHFHGLADIHNVRDQVREADLDETDNRRTRRGDHRTRQVGLTHLFADCPADNVRAAGNLKHIVKPELPEGGENHADILDVPELPVERRRGQCDAVLEALDVLKRINGCHLGMVIADADALAAVNAPLIEDMRASVTHTDGLGRTMHQAVCASLAQFFIQSHGMKPFFCIHRYCLTILLCKQEPHLYRGPLAHFTLDIKLIRIALHVGKTHAGAKAETAGCFTGR